MQISWRNLTTTEGTNTGRRNQPNGAEDIMWDATRRIQIAAKASTRETPPQITQPITDSALQKLFVVGAAKQEW